MKLIFNDGQAGWRAPDTLPSQRRYAEWLHLLLDARKNSDLERSARNVRAAILEALGPQHTEANCPLCTVIGIYLRSVEEGLRVGAWAGHVIFSARRMARASQMTIREQPYPVSDAIIFFDGETQ